MSKDEVAFLREEIERIDSGILELLKQRERVSLEIGLVKQKDGLRLRDKKREDEVKRHFRERARLAGVNPSIAVSIAELLISDSISVQRRKAKRDLSGKSVLVVGGSGRMGAWTCRQMSNRGAAVSVWDPRGRLTGYDNTSDLAVAAHDSDITVIASPLGAAQADLKLVLQSEPKGLVFDICSVKTHLEKQLGQAARRGVKVASVHPMFGPNAPSPKDRNVIVCDCGSTSAANNAERLFSAAGANTIRMSIEKHDELIAYVLGLSHLNSLLFTSVLVGSGESLATLKKVQGPSFERMLATSRDLSRESVRIYHDIQALNPNTRVMFTNLVNSVKLLKKASIQKEPTAFRKIMESNRKYLEVR